MTLDVRQVGSALAPVRRKMGPVEASSSCSPSLLATAALLRRSTARARRRDRGRAASAPTPPRPRPRRAPAAAAPAAPAAADPLVGKPAPDFTATAQDGTSVHLAALKGKRVVVYFYPKDETPGCTKEACSFRDAWQDLAKTGAVLIGVSADTTESHKAFAEHWKLPFLLVSDPDGKIGKTYGVPFAGLPPAADVRHRRRRQREKVYRKVDVTVHAAQVLDDLKT